MPVTVMYTLLFVKIVVVLVSSPKYLGLGLILQEQLLDGWKWF